MEEKTGKARVTLKRLKSNALEKLEIIADDLKEVLDYKWNEMI